MKPPLSSFNLFLEEFQETSVFCNASCLLLFLGFTPRKTRTGEVLSLRDTGSCGTDACEALSPRNPVRSRELEIDSVTVKQKKD